MHRYSHRVRHHAAPCVPPHSRRRRGKGIDLVAMLLAGLGQALALVIHARAPGLGDWFRQAWSTLCKCITSPMDLRARAARRAAWRASRSRRGRWRGPRAAT
jgi:hypothetical protein